MNEFGKNKTVAHWTEYLQHILNNRLVCGELRWIENWIEKIQANIHFASPSEIQGGLKASWNLWTRFFEEFYPELFLFLKKRHFFLAGTRFLSAINRIKNPTLAKFHRLSNKYKIANTVGIFHTVIKATVILLSKNHTIGGWDELRNHKGLIRALLGLSRTHTRGLYKSENYRKGCAFELNSKMTNSCVKIDPSTMPKRILISQLSQCMWCSDKGT